MLRADASAMSHWHSRGLLAAGLVALTAGCVGEIGGDRLAGNSAAVTCDANTRPSATDLHRLTAQQYRSTVADLFAGTAGFDVDAVAGDALTRVPADGTQNGAEPYTRMDTRLSPPHVEAYFDIADVIARKFEADAAARAALIGDCANDAALTDACVDTFLDTFAWRAFRRPLEQEERD